MARHLRSVSLPSKSYYNEIEIEAELLSLEASISSPSTTTTSMCDGLRRLGDVYSHIEEIINLPSNQVSSIQQKKMLEREMESSLELIDLCNAMHEIISELKTTIQDLQVVLRRGDARTQAKIQYYTSLVKKAHKQMTKISKKSTLDKEDCKLVKLSLKARMIAISLLESTVCLLSKQVFMPKRSLVSKAFQKRRIVICEEQLQELECITRDLENGTEVLLRIEMATGEDPSGFTTPDPAP
ncbi:hypothetical protein PR202_ga10475 [Eleusine coracana subsp. coracana]|uniref:Uncharacterized protein n=1 Tax=Eleusine coracana subsp. coracana TaxID=191504 RepID=A0AAV5C6T6_ELECO|nr:hypothetical protein PR202_ga10475 [Eleusine coracana subsp. coracana]